ncbi:MAG TPA: adenosine deaminase [Thermoanaerobaculia bacterium]|nr:adenosine deaminase [Thermoanaerobaculia bacterium]
MRNGFPLIDLHRHLDGNVRLGTVLDLGRQHGLPLPAWTAEALRPHVQVMSQEPDLLGFLAKFALLKKVMVDYEAVRRIARENLEDAMAEGIDYLELRFSPYFMAEEHRLDPFGVVEAVCDALEEAEDLPVAARLIVIISRHYGPEIGEVELETAIRHRHRGVVALDLAGDEAGFPGELFVRHFARARDEGLRLLAHAGEAAGAASVRQAILGLGAERIGHGVRAIEDQEVLDLIEERGITLECCPTSNLQTSTVPDLARHPLPAFVRRGLLATLNTDDPSISGIDLAHEYRLAATTLGMSEEELRRCQENAFEAAFLSDAEKAALLAGG